MEKRKSKYVVQKNKAAHIIKEIFVSLGIVILAVMCAYAVRMILI